MLRTMQFEQMEQPLTHLPQCQPLIHDTPSAHRRHFSTQVYHSLPLCRCFSVFPSRSQLVVMFDLSLFDASVALPLFVVDGLLQFCESQATANQKLSSG